MKLFCEAKDAIIFEQLNVALSSKSDKKDRRLPIPDTKPTLYSRPTESMAVSSTSSQEQPGTIPGVMGLPILAARLLLTNKKNCKIFNVLILKHTDILRDLVRIWATTESGSRGTIRCSMVDVPVGLDQVLQGGEHLATLQVELTAVLVPNIEIWLMLYG